MRSIKSVLVALVAVLAFGAVAASGASAHEFRVEGKALSGEEAFTGTGGVFHLVIKIGVSEVKLECKKTASAGDLQGGGELLTQVVLSECAVTKPASCKLPAGQAKELGLRPDRGLLTGLESIEFKEAGTSEEVLGFELVGPECSLEGAFSVVGHWSCELHGGGTEAVEHEQVCRKGESHLAVGENHGTLEYTEKVKLASSKKWSTV